MAAYDIFPRLRIREVVILLVVIIGGLTTLLVNVAVSGHVKITGPAWKRLVKSGGSYDLALPAQTPLSKARGMAMRPFPRDTRTIFYVEKPFCITMIVRSRQLAYKVPPGVVDVEFQTTPKLPDALPFLDKKNVNTVLVTLLSDPDQRPSC